MIGTRQAIERLFRPRSVAVVGASEDPEKLSGQPLRNLLTLGYTGDVYAVNPRVEEVFGVRSYESLSRIRDPYCLPRHHSGRDRLGRGHSIGERCRRAAGVGGADAASLRGDTRRLTPRAVVVVVAPSSASRGRETDHGFEEARTYLLAPEYT
jgi:CoA binding domain